MIHNIDDIFLQLSTILPILKSDNSNSIDSANFWGIALISIFCKLIDNIILVKFHDKLCTPYP